MYLYEVRLPETSTQTLLESAGKTVWPVSCYAGNLPKSCCPESYGPLSSMHKTPILLVTLQLARRRTTEAEKQG